MPACRRRANFRFVHSIAYVQLAAALAKFGRLDEARRAGARALELHPSFRFSRQFAGVNCAPALAGFLATRCDWRAARLLHLSATRYLK